MKKCEFYFRLYQNYSSHSHAHFRFQLSLGLPLKNLKEKVKNQKNNLVQNLEEIERRDTLEIVMNFQNEVAEIVTQEIEIEKNQKLQLLKKIKMSLKIKKNLLKENKKH